MFKSLKRPLRVLRLCAALTAVVAVLPCPASAQVIQTQLHGFGDRQNSYSWSMAWFKGQLYVGTNRNMLCVERQTLQFYFKDVQYYSTAPDEDVPCPEDPYDLDLQAEIWTFSPLTQTWTRVFQSPNELPNPIAPDKLVARDIGFRDMAVFTEPNGIQALYAAGVSAKEYIPGLPPPRILRSVDGVNWAPVPQQPGTTLGNLTDVTFRAMKVYNGRLYVTASPGLTGDGVVLESARPWVGNNSFRQVTPEGMKVFEMEVFNNQLYVGTGDLNTGYAVSRTNATGKVPYKFTPVVTNGAGRGSTMTSVVSMHPFKGRLYVGSSGFANGLWPTSELIRITPDDKWELVAGNARFTESWEFKYPISGLPDSFGNAFNFHFWRMQAHQDVLFLGTNDGSYAFRVVPLLDLFLRPEYGFDLLASTDGANWRLVTRDGFGSLLAAEQQHPAPGSDFGLRTMASTQLGLFAGTANHQLGTAVLQAFPPAALTESTAAATQVATAAATRTTANVSAESTTTAVTTASAPTRLTSERQGGVTLLSWGGTASGTPVRVLRAEYAPRPAIGQVRVPWSTSTGYGAPGGIIEMPEDLLLSQGSVEIGQTTEFYFVDATAVDGVQYLYSVETIGAVGQKGKQSNIAYAPSLAPVATLSRVQAAMEQALAQGKIPAVAATQLFAGLARARAAIESGAVAEARTLIAGLQQQVRSDRAVNPLTKEELDLLLSSLLRRMTLTTLGLIPADSLL